MANNFTAKASGIMLELRSACFVSMAWDNQSDEPEPAAHQFDGIWDTGATGSLISANVVERCDLKQTGVATIRTANGNEDTVPTYVINLRLPNQVVVMGIPVALGSFGDADVLIGMDVITKGDFAVSNWDGKTSFSFRVPSRGETDFVKEEERSRRKRRARR